MKFLHLSDLHIGKKVNGFSMLEEQKYIFDKILQIVSEEKPQAVIIAGDIYDKPMPSVQAVALFDEFLTALRRCNADIFIISGNHDSAERISFGSSLLDGGGVHIAPVFGTAPSVYTVGDEYGEIKIYMLPFVRVQNVRAALEDELIEDCNAAIRRLVEGITLDGSCRNIFVCHQFLSGSIFSESEEMSIGGLDNIDYRIFDDFDYVALGHIHGAQSVGREQVRYCGTPLKYSFSEAGRQKSVTMVDMKEKGQIEIIAIPLEPLHDMRNIRGSFEQVTDAENYQKASTEDYVHITLTDEEDIIDVAAKLKSIYPNLMLLDYDNTRTRQNRNIEGCERAEEKTPLELFELFYENQNNQPMNDEQRKYMEKLIEKVWRDSDETDKA